MTKRLLNSGAVSMIVSEENENVIYPVRILLKSEVQEGITEEALRVPFVGGGPFAHLAGPHVAAS